MFLLNTAPFKVVSTCLLNEQPMQKDYVEHEIKNQVKFLLRVKKTNIANNSI